MKTLIENVRRTGKRLEADLEELLRHSKIGPSVNRVTDGVAFYTSRPFPWGELPPEMLPLQRNALSRYKRFVAIVRALLRGHPQRVERKMDEAEEIILEVLEQDDRTHVRTTEEALASALDALHAQVEMVASAFPGSGRPTFVPDTNALYFNLDLEAWAFDGVSEFDVALVPAVLSDLDRHKVEHGNEGVRKKAERLVRQISEYRRRGPLAEGVTLSRRKITLFAVATEPDFGETLSWLDPSIPDDRILASVLEVTRDRPNSSVILVTRDINLQNKAEFALVPFAEPPDPPPRQ